MGLAILVVGLAVFIGSHAFAAQRQARAAVIERIGEGPYKIIFSVASLCGLLLIGWGFARYRAGGYLEVWSPPVWTRHLALLLMWPATIFVIAAYAQGNIKRWLKHPMLVGVKLWAVAHFIANGDLGSMLLFSAILAWAVYDRVSLKRRVDASAPPPGPGGWKNDAVAIVGGTVVYLAIVLVFHSLVIGVPALSR